jgi:hypothetical protein
VTTTRRLLGYRRASHELRLAQSEACGGQTVRIEHTELESGPCPIATDDCQGLTWYITDEDPPAVRIGDRVITDLRRNPPDETGRKSVSVPWTRLEFPTL